MPESLSLLHLIDFILVLMATEIVVMAWRARRSTFAPLSQTVHKIPAPSIGRFLPTLMSGVFLVLAMRMILTEAGSLAVMACLTGSLISHLADLWKMHRK